MEKLTRVDIRRRGGRPTHIQGMKGVELVTRMSFNLRGTVGLFAYSDTMSVR